MSELEQAGSLAPEDQARANLYGLLARLFYAAPDAALLRAIAQSGEMQAETGSPLAIAWKRLVEASAGANAGAVREEFERSFVGTGKADVTLYTGAYTTRSTVDSPLAELRGELAARGLARRGEVFLPEDHIGALCETMRHLIAEQRADLEEQYRFFHRWIWPAATPLCNAIDIDSNTVFYEHVGSLARALFELEHTAFEML
ncbi:MAG: molecular chaperone TorD family protein [Betaproteobacteria bacterium]|nr:molecular chaperone TorD family protein [Betaproteobacteria bacterium]